MLKFGVRLQRDPLASRFTKVEDRAYLYVRTRVTFFRVSETAGTSRAEIWCVVLRTTRSAFYASRVGYTCTCARRRTLRAVKFGVLL